MQLEFKIKLVDFNWLIIISPIRVPAQNRIITGVLLLLKIKSDANLYFMHTVKSKENISSAYFDYGVRNFALDNKDELRKILEATNQAKDLSLYVRIAISNEHAEIDLSRKFGALPSEALGLVILVL